MVWWLLIRLRPMNSLPLWSQRMKSALNMLTSVFRMELEADGIVVSLVVITAAEFGGGGYQPGQQARPGVIAHNPEGSCIGGSP
jgi:hypothetical protein